MSDDDKEKKYKYYFWLDEMVIDLWCEYVDLIVENKPMEQCDNKIRLIEFYQKEIESLSLEITFKEAHEWGKKNDIISSTQRIYDNLFGDYDK